MNKELIPKIRFKGFTEAWEQRKFTGFVEFYSGQTYSPSNVQQKGTLVLRSSNVQNGEISKEDLVFIDNKVVNVSNVKKDDIIVVVRNGSRNLIGKHAKIKENMPNTVIGAFMSGIRTNNPNFVNALLNTTIFENEISVNMGATINQITGYMFSNMNFFIPENNEQQKIGMLFDNLDNLITLHQRKCDKLIKIKQSMLEKLFPKNNQNIPDIRFKGFTEAWEQRKLSDISDICGGGTPSTEISSYWNGNINWYSPAEIGEQIYVSNSQRKITALGLDNSSARIMPAGTVLFTSRAGIGNMAILKEKACTNQGFQSIIPKANILNSYFIFSRSKELKNYSETVGAGSTFVEVSGKQMANMDILIPNIEEQNLIGNLFEHIDNLITLHQRKYEKLIKIKQSLLNDMFV